MNLENILNIAARIEVLRTELRDVQTKLDAAEGELRQEVATTLPATKGPHAKYREPNSAEGVLVPQRDSRIRENTDEREYKYTSAEYRRFAALLQVGTFTDEEDNVLEKTKRVQAPARRWRFAEKSAVWLIPSEVLLVRNAVYKARPDRYAKQLKKGAAPVETKTAPGAE